MSSYFPFFMLATVTAFNAYRWRVEKSRDSRNIHAAATVVGVACLLANAALFLIKAKGL